MLVSAAARRWNVDPASCRAQCGEVLHAPTGGSIKYGELGAAARMPIPESVMLKRPQERALFAHRAMRASLRGLQRLALVGGTRLAEAVRQRLVDPDHAMRASSRGFAEACTRGRSGTESAFSLRALCGLPIGAGVSVNSLQRHPFNRATHGQMANLPWSVLVIMSCH
jgi:hypothetical protein